MMERWIDCILYIQGQGIKMYIRNYIHTKASKTQTMERDVNEELVQRLKSGPERVKLKLAYV